MTAFIFSDLNYNMVIFLSQTESTPKHFFRKKALVISFAVLWQRVFQVVVCVLGALQRARCKAPRFKSRILWFSTSYAVDKSQKIPIKFFFSSTPP
jgi:hypothetical protein